MKVLGIDPGTAALGYGIVERTGGTPARGRPRLPDHEPGPARCPSACWRSTRLVDELLALHEPDLMGVERLFFSRNVQTALGVGQARGVVLLAAAQHGMPVREATPSEVKSAIAGYGAADKEQVQRMVQLVLGMSELPTPDDAADALAIATWVANTDRRRASRRGGRGRRPGRGRADHARRDGLRARGPRGPRRRARSARTPQRERLADRAPPRDRFGRGDRRRGRRSIRS